MVPAPNPSRQYERKRGAPGPITADLSDYSRDRPAWTSLAGLTHAAQGGALHARQRPCALLHAPSEGPKPTSRLASFSDHEAQIVSANRCARYGRPTATLSRPGDDDANFPFWGLRHEFADEDDEAPNDPALICS